MITITIDGNAHEVEPDQNLLTVLRRLGYEIPAICFHSALKDPVAACRLCAVEVSHGTGERAKIRLACVLKTEAGLEIKTDSAGVHDARTRAMQRLLQDAPESERLHALADRFGLETGPLPDGCIRCRLCERVCREVVKAGALQMEKREDRSYIVPIPGRCIGCGTCANICPTDAIRVVDRDDWRTLTIRDEIIGRHPLAHCESCGRAFATPRFLDHVHEASASHPDVKKHHQYCPTCAKIFSDRALAAMRSK